MASPTHPPFTILPTPQDRLIAEPTCLELKLFPRDHPFYPSPTHNDLYQTKGLWHYALWISNSTPSFTHEKMKAEIGKMIRPTSPSNEQQKHPGAESLLLSILHNVPDILDLLELSPKLRLWSSTQNYIYDAIASQGYPDDTLCFHKCQKDSFLKTLNILIIEVWMSVYTHEFANLFLMSAWAYRGRKASHILVLWNMYGAVSLQIISHKVCHAIKIRLLVINTLWKQILSLYCLRTKNTEIKNLDKNS